MNPLRIATPEETHAYADQCDLIPGSLLLALDTDAGTLFAVVRTVVEVDPLICPEGTSLRKKISFMRDIETFLTAKGVSDYYFNVKAPIEGDEAEDADYRWLDVIEGWGGEVTNEFAEYRFRKSI